MLHLPPAEMLRLPSECPDSQSAKALKTELALDEVSLTGLHIQCVVGVFAFERKKTQRVHCEVHLFLSTRKAAEDADLNQGVDYRFIVERVRFLLEQGRFFLLETAAEMIALDLLRIHSFVQKIHIKLEKPDVFDDEVVPALLIRRGRNDVRHFGSLNVACCKMNCIFQHRHGGLFEVYLEPHQCISLHFTNDSVFLIEQGELVFSEKHLAVGRYVRLEKEKFYVFSAKEEGAKLLCLTAPQIDEVSAALKKLQMQEVQLGIAHAQVDYVHE